VGDAARPDSTTMQGIEATLATGTLEMVGLVPWSSNYTFLVRARRGADECLAVYKPAAGERPLWDFPPALYKREVAAHSRGRGAGRPLIPAVVAREGPHGLGSVQYYVENDPEEHFFTLRDDAENVPALQRIALYDALVNNADRKAGHVLRGLDGSLWAIDHGLTFHRAHKLRTVIWDWAGQPIPEAWLEEVDHLRGALSTREDPLRAALDGLLSPEEVNALRARAAVLLRRRTFTRPLSGTPNVPWPLI